MDITPQDITPRDISPKNILEEFVINPVTSIHMEDFQYFGLFLDNSTRDELISFIRTEINSSIIDDADNVFLDHCTLLHVSQLSGHTGLYNHLEAQVGREVPIKLIALGMSGKAFAFKVALPEQICVNKIPHITIATYRGGKPVESNNIIDWEPIKPIEIITTLNKR